MNHYQLYLEQVFQLAETLVIKSEDSAQFINDRLVSLYGRHAVDQTDKTSWKYYLHLAGKYHTTDTPIIITSLDTLDEIVFNAENLKIHTATKKAYEYGSRYYRELVSQHPGRDQLILGVLYPVDIQKAIDAPDFSVLGYPPQYVEDNEESLIPNIDKWLANYKTRWYNLQYNHTDGLNLATVLGIMYHQLVPLIKELRKLACKTSEAHSFHVREYLTSHGMLDEYLDYMTKKQALFFYRNINYIDRHAGKQATFDWILEKILTDRDIPVADVSLLQDESQLLTNYRATPRFQKTPLNVTTSSQLSSETFYTLTQLLSKEKRLTEGNEDYVNYNTQSIADTFLKAKSNKLPTKVLDSKMIDYTDSGIFSIHDIALDLWCYMSTHSYYTAYINYTDRLTNQTIPIPNHVAFLYYLYSWAKINDIPIEIIPELYVTRVAIDPIPTNEEVLSVVDKKYMASSDIDFIKSIHTPLEHVISTTAFTDLLQRTLISYKAQTTLYMSEGHIYRRALLKNATLRMYKTERVLSPYLGASFEQLFRQHNLPVDISKEEWGNINKEIYKLGTGLDIQLTQNKAMIQTAMVNLFLKLSSYSIQFLTDINKNTIRSFNWTAVRWGDISRYGKDWHRVKLMVMKLFKKLSISKDYRFIELKDLLIKSTFRSDLKIDFIDATINAWATKPKLKQLIKIDNIKLHPDWTQLCGLNKPEELPWFKPYFDLTDEERYTIKDVYTNRVTDEDYIPPVDIDSIEHIPHDIYTNYLYRPDDHIPGFQYWYIPQEMEFRPPKDAIDLNAFYPNFGELQSKAFKPFIGFKKNNRGFRLAPGPIESFVKSFIYTGGIEYSKGFGYSLDPRQDMDLGNFKLIIDHRSLEPFNVVYQTQRLIFKHYNGYQGTNIGEFKYISFTDKVPNFRMTYDRRKIDIGKLYAGSQKVHFKYGELLSNGLAANWMLVEDIRFDVSWDWYELGDFKLETAPGYLGEFTFHAGQEKLKFKPDFDTRALGKFKPVYQMQIMDYIWNAQGIEALLMTYTRQMNIPAVYHVVNETTIVEAEMQLLDEPDLDLGEVHSLS